MNCAEFPLCQLNRRLRVGRLGDIDAVVSHCGAQFRGECVTGRIVDIGNQHPCAQSDAAADAGRAQSTCSARNNERISGDLHAGFEPCFSRRRRRVC